MRRKRRKGGGRNFEVTVEAVGARGDGLATSDAGETLYIPLTLPGERVLAREDSPLAGGIVCHPVELLELSDERVDPPCPHFGACGGCQLQHWTPASLQKWKQRRVEDAVSQAGYDAATVLPLISVPADQRRRARLAIEVRGKKVDIGFRGRASHALEPVTHCLVLRAPLMEFILGFADWLKGRLPDGFKGSLILNEADNGIDALIDTRDEPPRELQFDVADLSRFEDLARLSWAEAGYLPMPMYVARVPIKRNGPSAVELPPGGFLQPAADGEAALLAFITERLPESATALIDLFSGSGTFSLPVADRFKHVDCYEGSEDAIAALEGGAPANVKGIVRDLERWPVQDKDFRAADVVILDPPRAGALPQIKALADRRPPSLFYVSCNPVTFARDAKVLKEAGYELAAVQPVDQFAWTAHTELAAHFTYTAPEEEA